MSMRAIATAVAAPRAPAPIMTCSPVAAATMPPRSASTTTLRGPFAPLVSVIVAACTARLIMASRASNKLGCSLIHLSSARRQQFLEVLAGPRIRESVHYWTSPNAF